MADEFEVTYRILSEDPEGVFLIISTTRSVGPFDLVCKGLADMRDIYFDTADASLKKRRYALRLRIIGTSRLLALKGRERVDEWGGIRRLEIEGAWSQGILDDVFRETGMNLPGTTAFDPDDPESMLKAMGLVTIQSRTTSRTTIDVFTDVSAGHEPVAELALDKVCYEVGGKTFLHYELEVEAKGNCSQERISGFSSCLRNAFPGMLELWRHNKLVTGCALSGLITKGHFPQDTVRGGIIPSTWYGTIDKWIRSGRGCSGQP